MSWNLHFQPESISSHVAALSSINQVAYNDSVSELGSPSLNPSTSSPPNPNTQIQQKYSRNNSLPCFLSRHLSWLAAWYLRMNQFLISASPDTDDQLSTNSSRKDVTQIIAVLLVSNHATFGLTPNTYPMLLADMPSATRSSSKMHIGKSAGLILG
jgi:hypothetical protein